MFKPTLRILAVFGLLASVIMPAAAQDDTINGVGFGDSLMAGYQLPTGTGFTDQLQKALGDAGYDVTIANAGVSGDTTSGGLARIDWSVPATTDFVILELGGNDALRGISPDITKDNLDQMIVNLQKRDIDVILVGILAPPNMGDDYEKSFNPIYDELAQEHGLPLYPFFLEGVIPNPDLMLDDGIHPNEEGVEVMVKNFMPFITQFLDNREAD